MQEEILKLRKEKFAKDPGSEYWDADTCLSVSKLIKKDENGRFRLKLAKKKLINHDVMKLVLEYPDPNWISGIAPMEHIMLCAEMNGEIKSKPYTPTSPICEKGQCTVIMKIYRKNDEFPNGGKVTQHIENNWNVGDMVLCKGPIGMHRYCGNGKLMYKKQLMEQKFTKIGLLAGGTGLTPMLALA